MKLTLLILFVTLVTFSGNPNMIAQQPIPEKFKSIVEPIRLSNDSLGKKYFSEIKKLDNLTDKLISKTNKLEDDNILLRAEIKRLNRLNEFFKNTIDTVQVHDTVFKKRKFFQLFKKSKKHAN